MAVAPDTINLWATPRSCSTALLYAFAQHPLVTEPVDEPLYAAFLNQGAVSRPPEYVEKVFAAQSKDAAVVVKEKMATPPKEGLRFNKHVSKQVLNLDLDCLKHGKHFLLTRDPIKQLAAWKRKTFPLTIEESGFPQLVQVWSRLKEMGQEPIVVDADILLSDPEGVLTELCGRLGIPFDKRMLSWPAGPKAYDGVWAYHWYDSIHKTTGFDKPKASYEAFPDEAKDMLRAVMPFYTMLRREAIAGALPLHKLKAGFIEDHGLQLPALPDARNANILIWIGDRLVPRELAGMSVFDSTVQGGDAVWEGLRVYNGHIFNFEPHLRRMINSAKAMAFADIPTLDFVRQAVFQTLAANGMRDGVHIRMTLSRGEKTTSSMNPKFNVYGSKLVIVPEWKPVGGAATYDNSAGIKLITATNRRNGPQFVDSKIHHCNLINNILPKIQANLAGAHDAIMLDPEGFVSETNATNLFCVRGGEVLTPHPDFCLPGTTRATVIELAKFLKFPMTERRISLAEFHSADEVFTTGTMGELTPVVEIDGRVIGSGSMGPITKAIMDEWRTRTNTEGTPLPF